MALRRRLAAARRRWLGRRPAQKRAPEPPRRTPPADSSPVLAGRELPSAYATVPDSVAGAVTDVVLLCRHHAVRTANQVAVLFGAATIHLLTFRRLPDERAALLNERVRPVHCSDYAARGDYLSRVRQPQVVIEVGADRKGMLDRLWQLFPFLAAGGLYVLEAVPGAGESEAPPLLELQELAAAPSDPAPNRWSREYRTACRSLEFRGELALVGKQGDHRIKLRDQRASGILTDRYADRWGEVVATIAPTRFVPDVELATFGEPGGWSGQIQQRADPAGIDVPELSLRRYAHATCWTEQRVARDNYWLPDTFRHAHDRSLNHIHLTLMGSWHARLPDGAAQPSRHVDGPLFYFDTEYPGHYGHVLTEVISRYWGWQRAVAREPRIRPLLSLGPDMDGLPAFQRRIFEVLGIDVGAVEYIRAGEAVTVSDLYAATPMYSMPRYVSPELRGPWGIVRDALYRPDIVTPPRVFAGRRVKPNRSCLNSDEVEAFFTDLGFEVFYPEDHDIADQITTFANAEIIAGFAGSNLLTTMFAPGKTVISITADTFGANNDFLIAAVNRGRVYTVIGDAEIKHPDQRWTWAAYWSNFTVDLDLLASAVQAALAEAPRS